MIAARHPDSTMTPRVRLTSRAGGVVIAAGARSRPSSISTVPMSPVRTPAALSRRWARWATVVLPLVPVTPATNSFEDGSP